jgi:SEC-C motif domain protein
MCPCGSKNLYNFCCLPLHQHQHHAISSEQLMRSRYSAYAKHIPGYILDTWHPSTRPKTLTLPITQWLSLHILRSEFTTVEFLAFYKNNKQKQCLHETSQFILDHDRWFYLKAL